MATWTYLDAYVSSIPAAQRQSLLNLVYSDILSQKIQTLADYESQLSKDLADLANGFQAPLFTFRTAPFRSITSSINFNDMEQHAITALDILYKEALLIEDSIKNYSNVITGNLDSIEATVARLEKQVDTLEILAVNAEGYITSVYDSFNEQNTYRLNRVDAVATTPFIIPDIGFIPSTKDAQIIHNSLQLPLNSEQEFRVTAARLENQIPVASGVVGSEDIPTEQNAFGLAALLDSNPLTYWAQTVDIPTLSNTKAEADLVLDIAGTQQINNITINPFTRFPYQITSISYSKNKQSGIYYEMIDDLTTYPITIGKETTIQFSSKYTDSIKLHIEQQNYSALRYVAQGSSNTITQIFDVAAGNSVATSALSDPESYYFAMTNIMQDLLDTQKSRLTDTDTVNVYEFLYGIKSINFSQMQYLNQGIYVTKPYSIPRAGAIGLNVVQSIADPSLASVEYDVLVEYRDIAGSGVSQFQSSFAQNILPASIDTITGEVLDGTNSLLLSNWKATSRFGVDDVNSIEVFQNNILLDSSFYTLSTPDVDTGRVTITIGDSSISPAQRNISFYTINYIPVQESYVVELDKHDEVIVNLRIFLRSASPNRLVTPSIDSYSMKFKQYVGT